MQITFRNYTSGYLEDCLELFDANSPEYFSPNEKADYEQFLRSGSQQYELCCVGEQIAGAYGLSGQDTIYRNLNWIMLNPRWHGIGIGATIMERAIYEARREKVQVIHIAASHKSAGFFEKFGAHRHSFQENGWGKGMHRVDMELELS